MVQMGYKLQTICLFFIMFLHQSNLYGQKATIENVSINQWIDGTLVQPTGANSLVIIIAGSGPVDRNGNQNYYRSSYLKKLADGLAENGIASFRYDKRVIKQLKSGIIDQNIRFEDFIADAKAEVSYFNALNIFDKIFIAGHNQGALVAMLASSGFVSGIISLNGNAKNIGDTLIEQVRLSAPELTASTERVVAQLKSGNTTSDYPKELENAFNLETQPFLISWMNYDPIEIIRNQEVPILIVGGDKDLQVNVENADLLNEACGQCEIKIIAKMNHVLFQIEGDEMENYKSYSDPNYNISEELISIVTNFVSSH